MNQLTSKVTMRDFGMRLIIGTGAGDSGRALEVREWTTAEDVQIGDLVNKRKDKSRKKGDVTAWDMAEIVVSTMCSRWGEHVFWTQTAAGSWVEAMSASQRAMILRQSCLCDVMYAYMWIRVESYGKSMFTVVLEDDRKIDVDLLSSEISVPKDPDKIEWSYRLSKPIKFGDREITTVDFTQLKWGAKDAYATSNAATIAMDIVTSSIVRFPELGTLGEGGVTRELIARLRIPRSEIMTMIEAVNDRQCGPDFKIDVEIDGETISMPIEWTHGKFFT